MELNLVRLATADENVSHYFFPALSVSLNSPIAVRAPTPFVLRDKEGNASPSERPKETEYDPIRITDIILYSYSKPILWLFFDEEHQTIRKRGQKKLTTESVMGHFASAGISVTGLKAWYIFDVAPEVLRESTLSVPVDIVTQERTGRDGLLKFFQKPKSKGMLQLFVDNKKESDGSMKNVFILCDYSPIHFRVDKAASTHFLIGMDEYPVIPLSKRVSPHVGRYETTPLLSRVIRNRVRRLCEKVSRHLHQVLSVAVTALQLGCRMDAQDRLFITWCSLLKIHSLSVCRNLAFTMTPSGTTTQTMSCEGPNVKDSVGKNVSATTSVSLRRSESHDGTVTCKHKTSLCALCKKVAFVGEQHLVTLRWILFAASYLDRNVMGWDDAVPACFGMVCPEMDFQDFVSQKDSTILNGKYSLCDQCQKQCNTATEKLTECEAKAPLWLQLDLTFTRIGKKAIAHAAMHSHPNVLPPVCLPVVKPSNRKVGLAAKELEKYFSVFSLRHSEAQQGNSKFSSATKDVDNAADLYDCSEKRVVWKKIGFGKPSERSRLDHIVSPLSHHVGVDIREVALLVSHLEYLKEAERLSQSVGKRRQAAEQEAMNDAYYVPPHTPCAD